MKKFIKPLVFLFAIAVTTGAYAQQDRSIRPVKEELKKKHEPATKFQRSNYTPKVEAVPNRKKDVQRVVRKKENAVVKEK